MIAIVLLSLSVGVGVCVCVYDDYDGGSGLPYTFASVHSLLFLSCINTDF